MISETSPLLPNPTYKPSSPSQIRNFLLCIIVKFCLSCVILFSFSFGVSIFSLITPNPDCRSTVYIIRHGEKGDLPVDLTAKGFSRARYLEENFNSLFPNLNRLYATPPFYPKYINREIETCEPISYRLLLPIHSEYDLTMEKSLADDITSHLTCGHSILVCWEHYNMPDFMKAFGICLEDWPDDDFDSIIKLNFINGVLSDSSITSENFDTPNEQVQFCNDD